MRKICLDYNFNKEIVFNKLNIYYNSSLEREIFENVYAELLSILDLKAGYAEFSLFEGNEAYAVLYTLGKQVEIYISACFENGEISKGLLADVLANEIMFWLGEVLSGVMNNIFEGKAFVRLAPFDDLDFCLQKEIVDLIDIGVKCNEYFVLEPSKSLSFLAVLKDEKTEKLIREKKRCPSCSFINCYYRFSDPL